MKKPGVTLQILWEEYRAVRSNGYGYSSFCELFRSFERRLSPTMRQDHVAGDNQFLRRSFPVHLAGIDQSHSKFEAQAQRRDLLRSPAGIFSHLPGALAEGRNSLTGRQHY